MLLGDGILPQFKHQIRVTRQTGIVSDQCRPRPCLDDLGPTWDQNATGGESLLGLYDVCPAIFSAVSFAGRFGGHNVDACLPSQPNTQHTRMPLRVVTGRYVLLKDRCQFQNLLRPSSRFGLQPDHFTPPRLLLINYCPPVPAQGTAAHQVNTFSSHLKVGWPFVDTDESNGLQGSSSAVELAKPWMGFSISSLNSATSPVHLFSALRKGGSLLSLLGLGEPQR